MAEIKSTLDLIMERTKSLTMSEDERNALLKKEWKGKIKGWVQKYQDGIIDTDTLKEDIETEVKKYSELRMMFKNELLSHIKLNSDNKKMFHLYEALIGVSAKPIEDLIRSIKKETDGELIRRIKFLKKELKRRKIYGSSVVPNPYHDESWLAFMEKSEIDFRKRLMALIDN